MTKLKLLDYRGKETIITLEKEIQAIFYQILSGDDVVYILYKDGTTEYFDSANDRLDDFFDGGDFIPLDKIKENKIFNVRECFENSLEED